MAQHYSDPERANDRHALPNIEIFYIDACDSEWQTGRCPLCTTDEPAGDYFAAQRAEIAEHTANHVGWYWQSCFPGCLPDGESNGPFATEAEAADDARDNNEGE